MPYFFEKLKTQQQIYDYICEKLEEQNCQSMEIGANSDKPQMCLYRNKDGKKCAVGHLIPDSLYDKSMEFNMLRGVLNFLDKKRIDDKKYDNLYRFIDKNLQFLNMAQFDLHDKFDKPSTNLETKNNSFK